jgi:hypothetical protein
MIALSPDTINKHTQYSSPDTINTHTQDRLSWDCVFIVLGDRAIMDMCVYCIRR